MRTSIPRRPNARGLPLRRAVVRAFTLIEVIVTLALVLVVLATLMQFMSNVEQAWRTTATDPFAEAQAAFETIANRAAQATLEPYQDYADAMGVFGTAKPDHLARRSDLAFVCGAGATWLADSHRVTAGSCLFFLAPRGYTQTEAHLGLGHLLNALGYFSEFSDEENAPTFAIPGTHRYRWRLKTVTQPTESLGIYTSLTSQAWIDSLTGPSGPVSVLAENVAALVILPEGPASDPTSLPPAFQYDSRDASNALTRGQLPARLRLALVAIDEVSAQTIAAKNGEQPPLLVAPNLFVTATQFDTDLATLDASLIAQKIHHRIFQRDISLQTAAWTTALAQ